VVGVRLVGVLPVGCTATDLVLTLTQLLRKTGVVGAFVEYFGEGLKSLTLPDRATIANMSPEYGATMGFFPIDERTVEYLRLTGREVEAERTLVYAKANALYHDPSVQADYDHVLELDLATVVPSIAGPARPQDLIPLDHAKEVVSRSFATAVCAKEGVTVELPSGPVRLRNGALAIAAITSCTNTSNPAVMLAAALLARNAVDKGLKVPPWVKTSLAPGSQVVMEYLEQTGLTHYLERLGFYLAAYGCTTCIGNSGPLHPAIETAQEQSGVVLAAALSGNRNFEGRIHPRVKSAFLMSPPLVVAYALAGRMDIDLTTESLGDDATGDPVYLSQIWPTNDEIERLTTEHVVPAAFKHRYQEVFLGDRRWQELDCPHGQTFAWQPYSTYIAKPPFFVDFPLEASPVDSLNHARALLVLGDSVTTDHISPAGSINESYPAGRYLTSLGISPDDFNSYGSRRGNHEVMMRGTFANTRIRQRLCAPKEGGFTLKLPEGELMHVYDAAMRYAEEQTPLVILAGKEYGTGSSRDWAAKGTALLGVRAV
ncbi:MAG: aconitate hydratase, partial [Deltaproteobacteria bacterium HGW-Deltaproteobacteria-20]